LTKAILHLDLQTLGRIFIQLCKKRGSDCHFDGLVEVLAESFGVFDLDS